MDVTPPHRDLVVIGASAGGVEALKALTAGLPLHARPLRGDRGDVRGAVVTLADTPRGPEQSSDIEPASGRAR